MVRQNARGDHRFIRGIQILTQKANGVRISGKSEQSPSNYDNFNRYTEQKCDLSLHPQIFQNLNLMFVYSGERDDGTRLVMFH
jgi:hypothetical protein